jgi:hypothetical protein
MSRTFTRFWLALTLLCLASRSASAFSLLGPIPASTTAPDGWEQPVIAYQLGGDIGTPKNIGEGYRWNTPVLYYAVDANFLNYFGSNGLAAVDQAFAIINNLNNVDSYSPTLAEWPFQSSRVNERADAIGLLDLKSVLLHAIVEQLGMAEPDRYVWTLRARVPGIACPITAIYGVIQRNFDPVSFQPSSYINGTLYSYEIEEFCGGPNPLAETLNFPVDPAAPELTAVASFEAETGVYYTGLTRDDVGALRYAWATNRMYLEAPAPTALLEAPAAQPTLIVTSNLAVLQAALTNTPAALQALFPTLIITSAVFSNYAPVLFTNSITVTDYAACIGQPVGCIPPVIQQPVVTTNYIPIDSYTFGNVLTNFTYTNNGVLVSNAPGEYILVPANQCGFQILSNAFTSVVATTNTNTLTVTVFTNHTLVVDIFNCVTNSVALREGIEKIRFFRQDFDSLLSETWTPITNTFTLTAVSNSAPVTQTFYRVVTQPDFLITAADIGLTLGEPLALVFGRNINYNAANAGAGLAGPGTLNPAIVLTLNKVGPYYLNPSEPNATAVPVDFLPPFNESTAALEYQWGSFDGTTNDPVAYPLGTSIVNLENNVFLQITVSGPLPDGIVGTSYNYQLPLAGGVPPISWSLISVLQGVPAPTQPAPGLNLSPTTGLISGTPTTAGIYDFTVQVSDSDNRVSQRTLQIEIDQ